MQCISYYHGYPLKWKEWFSCYSYNFYGILRFPYAFGVWAYHNLMFWMDWYYKMNADEIIFISEARMHQFFQRSRFLTKIRRKDLWNYYLNHKFKCKDLDGYKIFKKLKEDWEC